MIKTRIAMILVAIAILTNSVFASQSMPEVSDKEAQQAIKAYLAKQKTETESADPSGSAMADLDGDGKQEIILVWTTLGPTYWRNTLTILSKASGKYAAVATFGLNGEATLSSVKDGIIFVDQKVFGKGDAACCPSVKKLGKYRLVAGKISEVKAAARK